MNQTSKSKIDKVFDKISRTLKTKNPQGIIDLQKEFHEARQACNFVVRGVWLQGDKKDCYRCSMIDGAGRKVLNEVDRDVILNEAPRAEHLMIKLKSLLVALGLFPAVGPKISQEAS